MAAERDLNLRLPAGLALAGGASYAVRALSAADGEAFAAHVAGDLPALGAFLAWPAVTANAAGAAEWLDGYARRADGRVVAAGLWHAGALVGGGVLLHHEPALANVELGIWVASPVQGRGVAAALCVELIRAARRDLGVERIVWQTAAGNTRSRRLAERLGFRSEGTLRSSFVLHGERIDVDILSLVGAEIDDVVR